MKSARYWSYINRVTCFVLEGYSTVRAVRNLVLGALEGVIVGIYTDL